MPRDRLLWVVGVVVLLLQVGCGSGAADVDAPPWLEATIGEISSEPVSNPPTEIWRYSYDDDVVYYRPARCCDIPSTVWDAEGAIVCHPDGGITGAGDGACPDFAAQRSNEHLVWRDPRAGGGASP